MACHLLTRNVVAAQLGAFVIALLAGCYQPPPPAPAPATNGNLTTPSATTLPPMPVPGKPASDLSASEILQQLLKTYREAKSYSDRGLVKLEFRQGGQLTGDQWPSQVQFVRPNQLSVVAFQATIKSDGKHLRAQITDPDSANLDGQILERPAPAQLKLTDLAGDPLLYDILSSQLRRQPIQLELLLESGGLAAAFGQDVACRKLQDSQAEGRDCFRIAVPSPGGEFVFWIDRANFLLRRLDYPVASLLPDLANDASVSDLRLSAELHSATIGGPIEQGQFALDVPSTAKRMKTLVIPPRPLPSRLFGKAPGEFFFTDLADGRVGRAQLAGKVAVLAWYHDHPACQATLEQLALARARLQDEPGVNFYAISTDPTEASNADIERRLAEWKVTLPIVRDLEAVGDKVFHIELQPTIVVLDAQGRVQIFQTGGNPQLADQVVQIAQRLKRGDDLATEIVTQHERERTEYEALVARGGPEPGQVIELPEAVIRQRTEPKLLKLNELWQTQQVNSPGNLLVVEEAGKPARLFVVEGWRTVVELDPAGKVVARHPLQLPEQAAVTYLRTAVDRAGQRYFVAAAPLAPQLFVFDADWKLLRTLPPGDGQPLQLADVQLADLGDADGKPDILAGSVGDIGLVAMALDGQVLWRNRALPNVVSVTVSPPNDVGAWGIFLAGDSGGILRVNRFGREDPEVKVGKWPVIRLLAGRFAQPRQAAFLALSNNERGELFAVGVTEGLKECWNYPLPAGVHQKPIEPIVSGELLPRQAGQWWLAGPDGSIHVISEDGEFLDSFFTGATLTGLATARFGERSVLLVASETEVRAWEVSSTATAR